MYPNWTYGFYSPTGLWNVMARSPVGCNWLLTSIYLFAWSKISFNFFTLAYFCWFLNCVYCIYSISVHWPWNLSLGALTNFLYGRIQIRHIDLLPPQACGTSWIGCGLYGYACNHQLIGDLQGNHIKVLVTVWSFWIIVGFRVVKMGTKVHWVNHFQFFQHNHLKDLVKVWCLWIIVGFIVIQRGTKAHWVNPLNIFKTIISSFWWQFGISEQLKIT